MVCDCRSSVNDREPGRTVSAGSSLRPGPDSISGRRMEASWMYHVTLRMAPGAELSLRVANQDLARTLALAARLEFLNPGLKVTYRAEPRATEDAA